MEVEGKGAGVEPAEAGQGWANSAAEPGWEGAGSVGGGRSWDLQDGVGGTHATLFRLDQARGAAGPLLSSFRTSLEPRGPASGAQGATS